MLPYKRVLVKLSGEVLGGKELYGGSDKEDRAGRNSVLDFDATRRIGKEIKAVYEAGIELSMVVGGGNILRGREVEKLGIERSQADYMGMLGTVINALALQSTLEQMGVPTRVQTAIEMRAVAEPYIRRRALRHMEKKRIVIFAAGTGSPYFSTDTTAALRAAEIDADCMVKGTKVDGVYDDDPKKNPSARLFPELSYREALKLNLKVMDVSAFSLCMENRIPILVINVLKSDNLVSALVNGERIGTIVRDGIPGTVSPAARTA